MLQYAQSFHRFLTWALRPIGGSLEAHWGPTSSQSVLRSCIALYSLTSLLRRKLLAVFELFIALSKASDIL
ncbi:MAG: hypothetical protein AAFV46_08400, partial [Cyanobacteria bacterium J06635_11]